MRARREILARPRNGLRPESIGLFVVVVVFLAFLKPQPGFAVLNIINSAPGHVA